MKRILKFIIKTERNINQYFQKKAIHFGAISVQNLIGSIYFS